MALNIEGDNKASSNAHSKKNKALDLEQIRQAMAKRSLDVKFDLTSTGYKPVENIGIGAYGVVCSAIHQKTSDRVAIKKIPHVFDALTIAKRTYREIKILKHFKHDNIICIREILKPKETTTDFKDIYVVFDLMESDLHRIIYSKQELSEEHVRYFLYQILRGLKYIHSANVIHRDLKPSNILVNEDCHLRIGDFGMARGIFYTPDEPSYYMTQYVATRWYRAPEILLSMLEYGTAVDMWSVGCIFAEMIGRKHLFPGKDYLTQVKLILGVLGTPSEKVMENCQNDILKRIIKSFGKKKAVEWSKLFPKTSKKSIDLLGKMLVLDPADRITPEIALSHRLLNNYHDPDDEPICVPPFNFDFEKEDMDKKCLRSAIMDEVMTFHEPKTVAPSLSFNAFLRPAPKEELPVTSGGVTAVKAQHAASKVNDSQNGGFFFDTKPAPSNSNNNSSASAVVNSSIPASTLPKPSTTSTSASTVTVDTSPLGLAPHTADVEMLSARSNMDIQETEHTGLESPKPCVIEDSNLTKETTQDITSGSVSVVAGAGTKGSEKQAGNKNTISEDTKALVKQALLNATQRRQRAESQNEDPKDGKPVTAMQRQKEREEKRRKKKERALEKVKKNKGKKSVPQDTSHLLSNQDMELLRRWTSMQQPAGGSSQENSNSSPPHPTSTSQTQVEGGSTSRVRKSNSGQQPIAIKAAGSGVSIPVNLGTSFTLAPSAGNHSGATVLIPASQLGELGQASFIPVIAVPSATNPGKIEIKRLFQQGHSQQFSSSTVVLPSSSVQTTTVSTIQSTASESTKTLLQSRLRERNQGLNSQTLQHQIPISFSSITAEDNKSVATGTCNIGRTIQSQQSSTVVTNFSQNAPQFVTTSQSNSMVQGSQPNYTNHQSSVEDGGRLEQATHKLDTTTSPSSLHSARTAELMEFLDQLKDSPAKLTSAASSISLQSPQNLSASFPSNVSGSLNSLSHQSGPSVSQSFSTCDTVRACDQTHADKLAPVLRRHNSVGTGHHIGRQHQQQSTYRPIRSSLPFDLFLDSSTSSFSSEQPSQPLSVKPELVGNTCSFSIMSCDVKQNADPIPFRNYMTSNFQNGNNSISPTEQQQRFASNFNNSSAGFLNGGQLQDMQQSQFHNVLSPSQQTYQHISSQQEQELSLQQQQLSPQQFQQQQQNFPQQFQQQNSPQQFQQQQLSPQQFQQQNSPQHFQQPNSPQQFQRQQQLSPEQFQQQQQNSPQQFQQHQQQNSPQQFQQQQQNSPQQFQQQNSPQQFQQHQQQNSPQQFQQQQHSLQQLQGPVLLQQSSLSQFQPSYNQFYQQSQDHPDNVQNQLHNYPQQFNQYSHHPQLLSQSNAQSAQTIHIQHDPMMSTMKNQSFSNFSPSHQPSSTSTSYSHFTQQPVESSKQGHQSYVQKPYQETQQMPSVNDNSYQMCNANDVPTFNSQDMHSLQPQRNRCLNPSPTNSGSSGGNKSPGLTVECGNKEASPTNGPANTSNVCSTKSDSQQQAGPANLQQHASATAQQQQQQQRQADLIALLSKQLSRAEVADIFPPALALTPRGTGAGYGVGMDLDSLLTDAQDGAVGMRTENSPLSSSLLADWLDLSSHISQADIEALEREMGLQSPMAVSYGDLGL